MEIMEGLITLEQKLEEAIELVKEFGTDDRVKAGILWNTYSAQLQTIINSAIETNNETEIAEYNNSISNNNCNIDISTDCVGLGDVDGDETGGDDLCNNSIIIVENCTNVDDIDNGGDPFDIVTDCNTNDDSTFTNSQEIDNLNIIPTLEPSSTEIENPAGVTENCVISTLLNISIDDDSVNVHTTDILRSPSIEIDTVIEKVSDELIANSLVLEIDQLDKTSTAEDDIENKNNKLQNSNSNSKYNCKICNKVLDSESELKSHSLTTHPKPYRCDECDASFSTKGNFNVHKRKHTGDRPFPCPKCTNRYTTSGNLRRHLLSHQGLKPYRCSTCDSRFTEKKSLLVHIRSHTGEKPYQCGICQKKYSQSSVLLQHMAIHKDAKPHLCQQCGKKFTQSGQLKIHEKRHSGIKNHVCPYCDSSFTTKSDMIRHGRIHSGEKSFVCDQTNCGKSFARSQSLKEHMFKHRGILKS